MGKHRLFTARHDEKIKAYCLMSPRGHLLHIFKMRLWITPPRDIWGFPALTLGADNHENPAL